VAQPTQLSGTREFSGIPVGSIWQSHKNGKFYEVVWGHNGWREFGCVREPMLQLREAGAQNLKNTHWVRATDFSDRYRRA
jgi:hypothetical protein